MQLTSIVPKKLHFDEATQNCQTFIFAIGHLILDTRRMQSIIEEKNNRFLAIVFEVDFWLEGYMRGKTD